MKSSSESKDGQLYVPLKLLCVLSLLGFVYCISNDTSHWVFFNHPEELKSNQEAYESMETLKEDWLDQGLEFSDTTREKLVKFYLVRAIIDVLALLGVALMNFKLKKGFVIYAVFQIAYVVSPFFFLDEFATVVIPLTWSIVHLVYIFLFYSQYKKLN
ncbi:MAG: hypothetical protein P8L23_03995 [Flavobacteriales bacterium]|nr:hypothetical protein [Flavobacteriales bacterium]